MRDIAILLEYLVRCLGGRAAAFLRRIAERRSGFGRGGLTSRRQKRGRWTEGREPGQYIQSPLAPLPNMSSHDVIRLAHSSGSNARSSTRSCPHRTKDIPARRHRRGR